MKKIIINPSKIKKIRLDNGPFFLIDNFEINSSLIETSIIDGEWDINTINFEDFYIFKSIEELINGKDWKETTLYNHLLDQIEKGNPKWGCINQEMVEKRGEYILDLYNYIKENKEIPKGYFEEDDICVSIDRNGSFIFSNNGTHRLCIAKILGIREIPVRVYNIHQKWNEYRLEVKELCDKLWDGKTYQNLPHPDFSEIETMWSDDRFDAIKNNTDVSTGTLLDIGSLFGNICYQAEQFGYECTAVEIDNQYLDVMKKLHKSYYMSYKIIENSFLEMCEIEYDIIVAYNIFHHFLKSETLFNQLNEFLDKITFKEMFIQTHKTTENQMSSAFMNFDSDEFAKFIAEKTNKKNYTCVGVEGGRKIYKIF